MTIDQNISNKATELFNKYGIRGITMDDISREVGISKKTLYNYILDKEELIRNTCDSELKRISGMLLNQLSKSEGAIVNHSGLFNTIAEILISKSIVAEYDLKKYYPEISREVAGQFKALICKNLEKSLQKGIIEGVFRADINVQFVAQHQLIQLEHYVLQQKQGDLQLNPLIDYHLRAVCSEIGLKKLNERKLKTYN